jgi:hypothetical protein
MHAPQDVQVFLNNALKATHQLAELECDGPLPETIRDMPDQVSGHFLALDASSAHDIEAAWKRVMILNPTQVLYTFTFDSPSMMFSARKR